jgi:hypothetical protein
MKRPYCCDASREQFERYYDLQQKGRGEFPVYVGRYVQKGHGIGNIIGSLFRRILPVLKAFAPHALRTGADVLDDVSQGKSWKEAAIKRVPEGLEKFVVGQTGSGKRKRQAKRDIVKKKRKRQDIFDGIHSRR